MGQGEGGVSKTPETWETEREEREAEVERTKETLERQRRGREDDRL